MLAWHLTLPSAVNSGHFMLLPTPAAVSFAAAWHAAAPAMLKDGVTDQKAIPLLEGPPFINCSTLCRCFRANHNVRWAEGPCCQQPLACRPACRPHHCVLPAASLNMQLTLRGERDSVAVFRTYLPSHYAYTQNRCTISSLHWMPRIDVCDWGGVPA